MRMFEIAWECRSGTHRATAVVDLFGILVHINPDEYDEWCGDPFRGLLLYILEQHKPAQFYVTELQIENGRAVPVG